MIVVKSISFSISGFLAGILICLGIIFFTPLLTPTSPVIILPNTQIEGPKEIIGFLPYWLLDKAQEDYGNDITTLTYFALRIDKDGNILKLNNPTEEEPGWYALKSGNADKFFQNAKAHNIKLSLAIDSGDTYAIDSFVNSPTSSAQHLVSETQPLLKQYGFSDLNLDIEYTQNASEAARLHFAQFVKEVRKNLPQNITLTLEISPIDAIEKRLIDIQYVSPYTSRIVMMAYDYHAPDSFVTGPIAPISGAGVTSEYDVTSAIEKTLQLLSPQKLILGVPLYGYEWETLGKVPRSSVIPGSGVVASNKRVEEFLTTCATCSAILDTDAQESYLSYYSDETKTNHIIFFPDKKAMQTKIDFAQRVGLAGIALWALGYEGENLLQPLSPYKNN